jgi:transposase
MDRPAASPTDLPDDVPALKRLIGELTADFQTQNQHLQHQVEVLQEQIRLLLHKRFGASSEKVPAEQLGLFNEAEADAEQTPAPADTITVPAHQRKKGGRKPLPASLPRVRVEHDLAEEHKQCACGCGLTRIGEETSEQLDIVPAQVRVIQNVRFTYACKACQGSVKTAPLPPQPIPKSNASAGLLAHIVVAKYQDALPLARQQRMLTRIGLEVSRTTLATWMIRLGALVQPLINLLREQLLAYDIQGMDETRIQVLKEPGRGAENTSQMWVQRGGPPDRPVVLFYYDPSRAQGIAYTLLDGFTGFLQADGYDVYEALQRRCDIILVGCMAHARRKFDEAVKAQGPKPKSGKAVMGLNFIAKLYAVEKEGRNKTPEERHRIRQEQARPIIEQMRRWLESSLPQVPPATLTGKALGYLHNQWDSLIRYLDDGRLAIDNNATERAIRPFVIGRRNWLFADTPKGAHASANLYSLIETAKLNGLEPYHYLRHLFKELPKAQSLQEIEALLPFQVDAASLAEPGAAE